MSAHSPIAFASGEEDELGGRARPCPRTPGAARATSVGGGTTDTRGGAGCRCAGAHGGFGLGGERYECGRPAAPAPVTVAQPIFCAMLL